jgi:hypothetical protein
MLTTINRTAIAMFAGAALTMLLLASSSRADASTIFACVKKHAGTTRIVSKTAKCKKGETKLTWNSQGPAGSRGATGPQGATGPAGTAGLQGVEGAQGPGATSFTATLPEGTDSAPLVKLSNGVVVLGTCVSGLVFLAVEAAGVNRLEVSGTANFAESVHPVDGVDLTATEASGKGSVDFDIIAADSTIGRFARIDVHGSSGSPCTFWGTVTPTS